MVFVSYSSAKISNSDQTSNSDTQNASTIKDLKYEIIILNCNRSTHDISIEFSYNDHPADFGTSSIFFSSCYLVTNEGIVIFLSSMSLIISTVLYLKKETKKDIPLSNLENCTKLQETSGLPYYIALIIHYNPGIHFSRICEGLNRENGVIQYHLEDLENKKEMIISHHDGGFHRYFPNTPIFHEEFTRILFSQLQHKTNREIIFQLAVKPEVMTNKMLRNEIGVSRQCISKICNELLEQNIIQFYKVGRCLHFQLTLKTKTALARIGFP